MEKVVENRVFNRRPPMFSCISLRKRPQCCKPKIGGETTITKKSQEGSTYVEGENRKRKNRKRRNVNCRRKGNWTKRKESKEKDYEKGSREQGV